jgi:hypothetical protein
MLQTTPPACDERQPERQEVRPVALGQRIAKSGGRPSAKWSRRESKVAAVSRPGSQAGVRKRQFKRAKRPHSIIQRPQGAGRPCYEAGNSACRGEWRREAGSLARVRLMSAWEREHGELPGPNLPLFSRKTGQGLFVFWLAAPNPSLIPFLVYNCTMPLLRSFGFFSVLLQI